MYISPAWLIKWCVLGPNVIKYGKLFHLDIYKYFVGQIWFFHCVNIKSTWFCPVESLLKFYCWQMFCFWICRNHRGLRHYWGLRVRGQHTKTTGRRGKTVGVSKKRWVCGFFVGCYSENFWSSLLVNLVYHPLQSTFFWCFNLSFFLLFGDLVWGDGNQLYGSLFYNNRL